MMLKNPKHWRAVGAFVLAAGMSAGVPGAVQADDHCLDSCCEPSNVFTNVGDRFCGRFKSLCGLWKSDDCCVDVCGENGCLEGCLDNSCLEGCLDACGDGCCDFGSQGGWNFGGWVQTGYHHTSNGMFNNNPNRLSFHQNWLYAEKIADGRQGWDWGGRFDIMYGLDANEMQGFGNSNSRWDYDFGQNNSSSGYGWAMPQAYLEVANGNWSIIAGRFFTLLGYERVAAPDNFFYSHSMHMYHQARTHTGVLATHNINETFTGYYGYTLGWDTAFDRNQGGGNFLGGFRADLGCNTSFTYITSFGDLGGPHNWGPNNQNQNGIGTGYSHSFVLDHRFGECNRWNYVFQTDYITATDYNPLGVAGVQGTESFGINQYLIYDVTDKMGVGSRFEWWRANGSDSYSATVGANYRPMDNLVIRPEVRYWFANNAFANQWNNAVANDNLFDGFVFGIDAILMF